jgi:hypothetical protein
MALFYLDPESEPRKCPKCSEYHHEHPSSLVGRVGRPNGGEGPCFDCLGTGRLGVEGAEPEIEIHTTSDNPGLAGLSGFWWREAGRYRYRGPFPTSDAALSAARAAHKSHELP